MAAPGIPAFLASKPLGWCLLGEALDWRTGVGGLLILAGIALATLGARPANSATVDVPAA